MRKTTKAPQKEMGSSIPVKYGTPAKRTSYAREKELGPELNNDANAARVAEQEGVYRVTGNELENRFVGEISEAGFDVAEFCATYGLKREELGRLTGFSLRALAEWAAGKLPSQPAVRRLREIKRLLDALADLVQAQSIAPWLHKRNPAFEGMTPLQVIEVGEMDRLWAMVYAMSHGVPE